MSDPENTPVQVAEPIARYSGTPRKHKIEKPAPNHITNPSPFKPSLRFSQNTTSTRTSNDDAHPKINAIRRPTRSSGQQSVPSLVSRGSSILGKQPAESRGMRGTTTSISSHQRIVEEDEEDELSHESDDNNDCDGNDGQNSIQNDLTYYLEHPHELGTLITNFHYIESQLEVATNQLSMQEKLLQQKQTTLNQQQTQYQSHLEQVRQQHNEQEKQFQERLESVQHAVDEKDKQLVSAHATILHKDEEIQKIQQRLDTQKSRNKSELKQQLDDMNQSHDALERENERLTAQLQQLQNQAAASQSGARNTSDGSQTGENDDDTETSGGYRLQLIEKCRTLMQEKATLTNTVAELQKELEQYTAGNQPASADSDTTAAAATTTTRRRQPVRKARGKSQEYDWESEREVLQKQLMTAEGERDSAVEKLSRTKAAIIELNQECNELEDRCEEWKAKYEAECNELDTKQQEYMDKVDTLNTQLETTQKQVDDLQQQLKRSQDDLIYVTEEKHVIEEENALLQEQLATIQQEAEELREFFQSEQDVWEQKNTQLQTSSRAEIAEVEKRLEILQNDYDLIKREFDQVENLSITLKQQDDQNMKTIESLQQKVDSLLQEMDEKEQSLSTTEGGLQREYELKLHALELTVADVQSQNSRLQQEWTIREEELNQEIECAQSSFEDCSHKARKLATEYKSLKKSFDQYKITQQQESEVALKNITTKLQNEIDILEKKMNTIQHEYDTLLKDKSTNENKIVEQEQMFEQECSKLEQTVEQLKRDIDQKEHDYENMISKYSTLQSQCEILEQQCQVTEKQRKQYLSSVNETRHAMNQLDSDMLQLKQDNEQLEEEIASLQEKLNMSNDEMTKANSCFNSLNTRYEKIKSVATQQREALIQLKNEATTLRSEKRHFETECQSLQREIDALRLRGGAGGNHDQSILNGGVSQREVPSSVRKNLRSKGETLASRLPSSLSSRTAAGTTSQVAESSSHRNNIHFDSMQNHSLASSFLPDDFEPISYSSTAHATSQPPQDTSARYSSRQRFFDGN